MSYPSFAQYNEAFQLHNKFLKDTELSSGTLKKTGLGTPLAIGGGFALTYTIECRTKKYAVRCFHKESKSLELRYLEISKKIKSLASPFFLDFEFQPNGILVDGKTYPIVKMAWASGATIGEFLEDNFDNQASIKDLGNSLLKLSEFLEQNGIAHGDLQTGNLMVSNSGSNIQLIDYDGMYIDELAHLGSAELGHINFQHPSRAKQNPYNSKLDRFSLIHLWLVCKALETDSTIWNKTKSEIDVFIFRSTDFLDPNTSQTFAFLSSYPALKSYINSFAAICNETDLNAIPSLSNFIQGLGIPTTNNIQIVSKNVSRAVVINEYISPYPVLSALDYNACFKNMGNQVEVIGKITEVKQGYTINGKPYIFINFGDWRGNIFKITIWSEGLDVITDKPDNSWVNKWISIKGLMESPFKSKKYKYSHISITLTKKGQLFKIDEVEAKKRLASKLYTPSTNKPSSNSANHDILAKIGVARTTNPSSVVSSQTKTNTNLPNHSTVSQNQAVLTKIHSTSKPTTSQTIQRTVNSSKTSVSKTSSSNSPYSTKSQPRNTSIPTKSSPQSKTETIITWIIWIVIILFVLKACS